jgi:predicted dehydrogenase
LLVTDYKETFDKEKLDGVAIALPNNLHAPVTEECAKRGLHVLCEKPIAGTLEETNRIIETKNKYGIKLLVGHHRRFSTYIKRLREAVETKEIGDFVCANIL